MRLHTAFAAMALFVLIPAAEAAPIAYTLSGDVTGLMGSTPLSNAHFSWTITTDTGLLSYSPPYLVAPALTDVIHIAGIGAVTPSQPFLYEQAPGLGAGMFLATTTSVGFSGNGLIAYFGQTAIGPLPVVFSNSSPVQTNAGSLIFAAVSALQFEAALVSPSTVPEPITLALFGAGLAGIGALRRRKAPQAMSEPL